MKSFLNSIYEFFFFLVRPSYWLMLNQYEEIVDTQLRKDLKIGFLSCDRYEAVIGEHCYWIANYPYGYGTFLGISGRPSRMTIYKTRKAQLEFLFKPKTKLEIVK